MGRKFHLELRTLKEITKDLLQKGDLVRLAIYGKVGLKRALFLDCREGNTFLFLMLDDNVITEMGPNAHWILTRIYLESRNEESSA